MQQFERDMLFIFSTIQLNVVVGLFQESMDPNIKTTDDFKLRFRKRLIVFKSNEDVSQKIAELTCLKSEEASHKVKFMRRSENDILKKSMSHAKNKENLNQIYKKVESKRNVIDGNKLINNFEDHLNRLGASDTSRIQFNLKHPRFIKEISKFTNSSINYSNATLNKFEYTLADEFAKDYEKIATKSRIEGIRHERKRKEVDYSKSLRKKYVDSQQIQNLPKIKRSQSILNQVDVDDSFSKTLQDEEKLNVDKKNISNQDILFKRLMISNNKNIEFFKRSNKLAMLERSYHKLIGQRETFNMNDFQLKFSEMKRTL